MSSEHTYVSTVLVRPHPEASASRTGEDHAAGDNRNSKRTGTAPPSSIGGNMWVHEGSFPVLRPRQLEGGWAKQRPSRNAGYLD